MNFEILSETQEDDRSPSQEAKLERILDYLEEKITTDKCDYLTIEVIAQENNLTNSEILEIGADPSNLIHLMAYRLNNRMIKKFCKTYLFATGFSTPERIRKYLLSLYQYDIENIKIRGAIHQYSWSQNKKQDKKIMEQATRLMKPIYIELIENKIEAPDARCHAIWSLYLHALRLSATNGAAAHECLDEIWKPIELICAK